MSENQTCLSDVIYDISSDIEGLGVMHVAGCGLCSMSQCTNMASFGSPAFGSIQYYIIVIQNLTFLNYSFGT